MAFKPLCRACMHWHWATDPCMTDQEAIDSAQADMERAFGVKDPGPGPTPNEKSSPA